MVNLQINRACEKALTQHPGIEKTSSTLTSTTAKVFCLFVLMLTAVWILSTNGPVRLISQNEGVSISKSRLEEIKPTESVARELGSIIPRIDLTLQNRSGTKVLIKETFVHVKNIWRLSAPKLTGPVEVDQELIHLDVLDTVPLTQRLDGKYEIGANDRYEIKFDFDWLTDSSWACIYVVSIEFVCSDGTVIHSQDFAIFNGSTKKLESVLSRYFCSSSTKKFTGKLAAELEDMISTMQKKTLLKSSTLKTALKGMGGVNSLQ